MKKPLFLLVMMASAFTLSGQSNQAVDEFLQQDRASFGVAASFVLAAAGMVPPDTPATEALQVVSELNRRLGEKDSGDTVNNGEFSLLVMRAFDIPGGIWYSLTHSRRYAFRELAYLGFMERREGPFKKMSGADVLGVLSRVANWAEARS